MRPICKAIALLALATSATAQDIRPQEADRLAAYDATAGAALLHALAGGARGDIDLLQEALEGTPLLPLETTLAGDWSCRTLKLGGAAPLTVYAPFACQIVADGPRFRFEKLTGSQRTTGTIQLIGDRMIYLGVGFAEGETPPAYADLPSGVKGGGAVQPQVGVVEQPSADRARILFPQPVIESDFDILFLTR